MSIYDISVQNIYGDEISLSHFKNKIMLIVNIASKWKFTAQLRGLEGLYNKYKHQDFTILAFPSNQFAGQEPQTNSDIQSLCDLKFGITFPLFSKIMVNGENESPLYTFLKSQRNGILNSSIKWSFTKFLVSRKGEVLKRFSPFSTAQDIEAYMLTKNIL